MTLKELLANDLKEAMKSKQQLRKSVITLLRSAIKQKEVDERVELKDDEIVDIISKQLKQRNEALSEFKKAQREDLISQTEEEIQVLLSYLPKQLTDEELTSIIKEAIEKTGASSMKDMGSIMKLVMPQVKGKADGKRISEIYKNLIQ